MSDNPPQYGERVARVEEDSKHALPGTVIKNYPATNEHDVAVSKLAMRRSVIRTCGTVAVFAVLMSPFLVALMRVVPQ